MMEGKDTKEESAAKRLNRIARPLDNKGPEGTELWDLGGTGDCRWRSIGAAIGLAKGKAKADIQKNLDRTVTFAKTHVASLLRRTEELMKDWKKGRR